jgi:hypothetical protein
VIGSQRAQRPERLLELRGLLVHEGRDGPPHGHRREAGLCARCHELLKGQRRAADLPAVEAPDRPRQLDRGCSIVDV